MQAGRKAQPGLHGAIVDAPAQGRSAKKHFLLKHTRCSGLRNLRDDVGRPQLPAPARAGQMDNAPSAVPRERRLKWNWRCVFITARRVPLIAAMSSRARLRSALCRVNAFGAARSFCTTNQIHPIPASHQVSPAARSTPSSELELVAQTGARGGTRTRTSLRKADFKAQACVLMHLAAVPIISVRISVFIRKIVQDICRTEPDGSGLLASF